MLLSWIICEDLGKAVLQKVCQSRGVSTLEPSPELEPQQLWEKMFKIAGKGKNIGKAIFERTSGDAAGNDHEFGNPKIVRESCSICNGKEFSFAKATSSS